MMEKPESCWPCKEGITVNGIRRCGAAIPPRYADDQMKLRDGRPAWCPKDIDIAEAIGHPALLEQAAEEAAEFAQACLKAARKMRAENPTPASPMELMENVRDETADILTCIEIMTGCGLVSTEQVNNIIDFKMRRWAGRIAAAMKEEL